MRLLRHAVLATLIGVCAPVALAAPAFAQTCACAPEGGGYVIQADEAPPPLPDYDQPPMPAPGYYWTPGYWAWNNVDYYWVPGVWVEPPQPGLLWTPGYWAFVGGVYAFRPGYWGPRVGFYGGINYGFGYSGRGYEGGRWEGQRFFYNTAVNNIGVMRVTNVYNAPVVVNNVTTINRVSFNGGTGGVVAAPTPQQLSAASEPHIPPTPLQQNHVRAASVQPQQFLNTNQGKPAVAATPRPGAFNAKEAVPAKAAGSLQAVPPIAAPNAQQKPPAVAPAPLVQPPPAPVAAPPKPPAAATAPAVQPPPAPVAAPPKPAPRLRRPPRQSLRRRSPTPAPPAPAPIAAPPNRTRTAAPTPAPPRPRLRQSPHPRPRRSLRHRSLRPHPHRSLRRGRSPRRPRPSCSRGRSPRRQSQHRRPRPSAGRLRRPASSRLPADDPASRRARSECRRRRASGPPPGRAIPKARRAPGQTFVCRVRSSLISPSSTPPSC